MKKAVFFDIDGTLIHSSKGIRSMRSEVKEAIRRIQAQGDYALIATGRPYGFLSEEMLSFGFDGFVLANGAHIILDGKSIYRDPMEKEFVLELVHFFEQHKIQYVLEGHEQSFLKAEFEECADLYEKFGVMRKMLQSDYCLDEIDVYKIEMLCPDEKAEEECLKLVEQHPDYDHFHSMSLRLFEMYPKKNTKATGILKVLEQLQIPVENSYAFGDGKNDIEMLQTVGCGIAMDNAEADVKLHADYVTDSVMEDGVASGVKKYILV